jgi:hypothetical protein
MYRAIDGTHPIAAIYFVALVLSCAYFVVNLFLAVLKLKFGKAQGLLQNVIQGQHAKVPTLCTLCMHPAIRSARMTMLSIYRLCVRQSMRFGLFAVQSAEERDCRLLVND